MASEQEQLQREIDALGPWFHNLHLPGGVQTAPDHFIGGDFPRFKWEQIRGSIPQDLTGWRVLDVGCNAGFYSFELARRGASVLAIDMEPLYLTQARWAAKQFGLQDRVEFREMQVYEFARTGEQFDLVWFMGVFYHLRYPLLALDILAQRTKRMMVFQTLAMPGEEVYPDTQDHPITEREPLLDAGWPKMAFIEHKFSGDRTNWWVPNHAGIEAMLRSSGLQVVGRPAGEIYVCTPSPETAAWKWDTQLQAVVGAAPGSTPTSAARETADASS
ncbi:TIGR04290 family methyltransferase [Ramlibacter ginsenosidimutans]|uniref:TIGR04290 family methyltransferase n=1 Tax=Ramlibacter ginsenosidimutans TaxID=502333 RepID=A0A934TWX0_9BURK|nr:TIGR04290 family methyltransferase [Ramlibacter ginsenosidimutans]MBK6008952.1 TIGR04290 family methyltransferase [Ramlibacter ginsenosidimutans]